ncbi:MAG: 50S ribosomal protein L3 [Verrucomicrobia bacterium]|nr:50S ribosomal protein L3 [Verrucomicrobiota bacterium]MCH8514495.1 50S ribosomal protein L3 [Kiritimatiellia bacterium]
MNAIIGRKVGMTQIFDENGVQIPVTVIEAGPCVVVQRKNSEIDGYDAVQLGFVEQKPQRLGKASLGRFAKAEVTPRRFLREFRCEADSALKSGDEVKADIFKDITYVDISGVSKGRGFQGVVKRYNFGGGRASHGGKSHLRSPGSIGCREWPGRVFKNKKMPGQMGNRNVTTQNIKVVQVREEDNVILVRGSVPGPNGGLVLVRKAIKKG